MTEATTKPRASRAKAAEPTEPVETELTEESSPAVELTIHQRIARIAAEAGALAPESKGGVPFAFRGIDGTVAHLTPVLNKYEVFAAPRVIDKRVSEREIYSLNKSTGEMVGTGRIVKTTDLTVEYKFFGPGGDWVSTTVAGLADDFADRSTAQAMSVAYRIALLQLFHLPTHTKEPEETGQAVLDGTGADAPAQRGPKAVEAAKAAGAPAGKTPVVRLQAQAKALGQKLNKSGPELNKMGEEFSGGAEQAAWFNDPEVMQKIVDALEAEAKA